jgi:hypothetical protein
MSGPEALDPAQFGALPTMGGVAILLPQFRVAFAGTSGSIGGTIVAGQFTLTGTSNIDLSGSLFGMEDVPMKIDGTSQLKINPPAWTGPPTGISFPEASGGLKPDYPTYREVIQ